MADLFALSEADVNVLREVVAAYRRGDLGRPTRSGPVRWLPSAQLYAAKAGSTGVAAATTAGVAGSANVSLCTVTTSGSITATTVAVKAYNLASSAVAGNAWIQLKREAMTGRWLVDFEDCG